MASFAKFGDKSFYAPEKEEELQTSIAILTEQFGLDSATVQCVPEKTKPRTINVLS